MQTDPCPRTLEHRIPFASIRTDRPGCGSVARKKTSVVNTAAVATVVFLVASSIPLAARQAVNEADDAEEILEAATRSVDLAPSE